MMVEPDPSPKWVLKGGETGASTLSFYRLFGSTSMGPITSYDYLNFLESLSYLLFIGKKGKLGLDP